MEKAHRVGFCMRSLAPHRITSSAYKNQLYEPSALSLIGKQLLFFEPSEGEKKLKRGLFFSGFEKKRGTPFYQPLSSSSFSW